MEKILLKHQDYLAKGGEKIVYVHPQDEYKLIKVVSPDYIEYMKKNQSWTYRLRRLPKYWFLSNTITEHLCSREQNISKPHYLQNFLGCVDTDMGLGLVVEAVRKEDGSIADSLSRIIRQHAFNDIHQQALDDFLAWVETTDIIIRDLALDNLVWHEKNQHFVLIDGIGGRYLPTLRAYCSRYNLRGNRKRADKLKARTIRYLGECASENNAV